MKAGLQVVRRRQVCYVGWKARLEMLCVVVYSPETAADRRSDESRYTQDDPAIRIKRNRRTKAKQVRKGGGAEAKVQVV